MHMLPFRTVRSRCIGEEASQTSRNVVGVVDITPDHLCRSMHARVAARRGLYLYSSLKAGQEPLTCSILHHSVPALAVLTPTGSFALSRRRQMDKLVLCDARKERTMVSYMGAAVCSAILSCANIAAVAGWPAQWFAEWRKGTVILQFELAPMMESSCQWALEVKMIEAQCANADESWATGRRGWDQGEDAACLTESNKLRRDVNETHLHIHQAYDRVNTTLRHILNWLQQACPPPPALEA